MEIFTGTSGFSYPAWRGSFYPAKLPPAQMLGHYAGRLRENSATWSEAYIYFKHEDAGIGPRLAARFEELWAEAVPRGT